MNAATGRSAETGAALANALSLALDSAAFHIAVGGPSRSWEVIHSNAKPKFSELCVSELSLAPWRCIDWASYETQLQDRIVCGGVAEWTSCR